jgi:hypothetical protein
MITSPFFFDWRRIHFPRFEGGKHGSPFPKGVRGILLDNIGEITTKKHASFPLFTTNILSIHNRKFALK